MTPLTVQYQRSLAYELNRFGHSLGYGKDGLLLEAEGKTVYATLGDRTIKFDLFLALKPLWGMKAQSLSSRELIEIMGSL